MTTTSANVGIKSSMDLLSFAEKFKKMSVAPFVNKETSECFKSCVFEDTAGKLTFVAFSSKLGELTPRQIAEQKEQLQVVELESGSKVLCKKGDGAWEVVDLGLLQ